MHSQVLILNTVNLRDGVLSYVTNDQEYEPECRTSIVIVHGAICCFLISRCVCDLEHNSLVYDPIQIVMIDQRYTKVCIPFGIRTDQLPYNLTAFKLKVEPMHRADILSLY
jgi:hypothetical protein